MEPIQVMTTFEHKHDARKVMRQLVAERLAACTQVVGPITSTYHWQGAIEVAEEWLCIIKTSRALYDQVEAFIKENHEYSVPEILAVPVVAGNPDYLAWLGQELKK